MYIALISHSEQGLPFRWEVVDNKSLSPRLPSRKMACARAHTKEQKRQVGLDRKTREAESLLAPKQVADRAADLKRNAEWRAASPFKNKGKARPREAPAPAAMAGAPAAVSRARGQGAHDQSGARRENDGPMGCIWALISELAARMRAYLHSASTCAADSIAQCNSVR